MVVLYAYSLLLQVNKIIEMTMNKNFNNNNDLQAYTMFACGSISTLGTMGAGIGLGCVVQGALKPYRYSRCQGLIY